MMLAADALQVDSTYKGIRATSEPGYCARPVSYLTRLTDGLQLCVGAPRSPLS